MSNPDKDDAAGYLGLVDDDAIDTTGSGDGDGNDVTPKADPEPKPEHLEPDPDPKNDPKRVEYWQSQADKHKNRADALERLAPLGKLVEERKDVRDAIEAVISGKPEKVIPKLQKPTVPQRPADYDPVEAVNDPNSSSFRYRAELETYNSQLMDFFDKRDQEREVAFEQARQESARREQAAIADQTIRRKLTEHGIIGDEQEKFFAVMNSPQSLNLDNLVSLYEVIQGKHTPTPKSVDEKQKQIEEQIKKGKAPLPASVTESQTPPTDKEETVEDVFNNSLFAGGKATAIRRVGPKPKA
jgi:hypothetical protein